MTNEEPQEHGSTITDLECCLKSITLKGHKNQACSAREFFAYEFEIICLTEYYSECKLT